MKPKEEVKKEIGLENLAVMVQRGFLGLEERMENFEKEIKEMKTNIGEIKTDTADIRANLNKKVDRFEHNELTYRVEKLEKKFA